MTRISRRSPNHLHILLQLSNILLQPTDVSAACLTLLPLKNSLVLAPNFFQQCAVIRKLLQDFIVHTNSLPLNHENQKRQNRHSGEPTKTTIAVFGAWTV
ncbi:MAG: hypothetical protein AUH89_01455 [Ktedonobacter sp. 13_1_40CM_4_52_4]|nr:MAG: hypothetical protein AUH89_01455 [Ktedonobacter sp. 13_1_40CM_4_52_4]